MNRHPISIVGCVRIAKATCAIVLAVVLGACGGGGGGGPDVGGAVTQIPSTLADRQVVVGQLSIFQSETTEPGVTLHWEELPVGTTEWRAATGSVTTSGLRSTLVVGPVDIAMDQWRYRVRATSSGGSVAGNEARLEVVWGTTAALEANSFDFGPGAGGLSGADGGSPGGGDGEGAGVGGGLGKTPRATIAVARVADGASLGTAQAGATSGLVRVKAGPGAAPFAITLRGNTDATYYDEGRDAMLPLAADQELHALALAFDRHLGVTILTEAAYRYALNHFLQDPDAVRAGTVPLKRTATAAEIARLTPTQIQLANEAIRSEINRQLPARYALDSISTLPTPVDNTSPQGSITDNIYGRMQAVVGGLSLAAARFEPSLTNPALRMNTQLADDLTDGVVDGLSLDQRTVFGATGTNAYGPGSLPALLEQAADDQFIRFGDGTVTTPPVITAQPTSAVITEGGTASLSVTATGTLLTYQWFVDGNAIPGATRPELSASSAGSYHVVVSNEAATVTSAAVTVTVVDATVAPSIAAQPVSTTVTSGDTATFTVQATGTDLRYQWQVVTPSTTDDLPGATSNTFSTATAGTYRVRITNDAGSVTSDPVTLTVTERVIAPRITAQPLATTIVPGQVATLRVEVSGNPLAFQWHNGQGPITGATASSHGTSAAGTYHVVVSNTAGTVESEHVVVNVILPPAITTHPASVTINQGQTTTLTVEATGTAPTYQWLANGLQIDGANGASYSTGAAGSYTVIVTNAAGSVTSNAATVTVIGAPRITTHPASITINQGDTTTLSVVATGDGTLTYQWYLNGALVDGATSSSHTTGTAGIYTVVVRNPADSVTSNPATVSVIGLPTINTHPASITIDPGTTTTLNVGASGDGTLRYLWHRDGQPITTATSSSYTTGTVGRYTVEVRNDAGAVMSNPAVVTVVQLPTITTHPGSITINQGQTITLTVVATTGGGTLTYQWFRNGAPIANANTSSYPTGTAGTYNVEVRNTAGPVMSNPATVDVIIAPVASVQPATATIVPGQRVTLTATTTAGTAPFGYQWSDANGPIPNATSSTYSAGAAGTYTVTVINQAGESKASAMVDMIDIPIIVRQPASATVPPGTSHTFAVEAKGTNLKYQWQIAPAGATPRDIDNANSPSYTTGTAGTYRVVVRNEAGETPSNTATLTVGHDCKIPLVPPKISQGATVEGRISLPVSNYPEYNDALFASAPDLPACGANESASRTWVHIYDAKTRERIYGFCALGRAADLQSIWVGQSQLVSWSVYVALEDRACGRTVVSNTINLTD